MNDPAVLRERGFRVKVIRNAHIIRLNDVTINVASNSDICQDADDENLPLTETERADWTHHLVAFSGPNCLSSDNLGHEGCLKHGGSGPILI
ncbi:hypothetical protein TW80_14745 [Loktanella sp. S4079]|nr:hypothetical protein TW80_14745 [Loktanella sp. S4079]